MVNDEKSGKKASGAATGIGCFGLVVVFLVVGVTAQRCHGISRCADTCGDAAGWESTWNGSGCRCLEKTP